MNEIRFFKESKALRQTVLVPRRNFFPQMPQTQGKRELGPDRIAIRSYVAEDRDPVCLIDCTGDFVKRGLHRSSRGFSRSCIISSTRLPRSIESSSLKLRCGVYFSTTRFASSRCSI